MNPSVFPARLHVLMAREAPCALILRRGPAKQVCSIGWNRANDTFELGQWFKGVIYEHRSDLSPDGKHFLYFAAKHNHIIKDKEWVRYGVWTAISRTPYLKALAFWGQPNTYGGGGHFEDDAHFWLNGFNSSQEVVTEAMNLSCVVQPPARWPWGMNPDELYALRLERGGWRSLDQSRVNWEKNRNAWGLRHSIHYSARSPSGRKSSWESYQAHDKVSGETMGDKSWEWADFDSDRLVWAQNGKLFALTIWDGGHGDILELADFNDWKFKNVIAPY